MTAGATYEPIATTSIGSTTASYTFTSIPSTYTDLIIIWSGTAASIDNVSLRFNGDTGTNYSATRIRGEGTAASTGHWSSTTMIYGPNSDSSGSTTVSWNVMDYANSSNYKTAIATGGGGGYESGVYTGTWRSTSAITSVTVLPNGGNNINAGTTLTLYGIASA